MIRYYPNEEFREIEIDYPLQKRYAVSNRGRIISFKNSIEDGILLKGSLSSGYNTIRYKIRKNGKLADRAIFVYRLVAELFIPKDSEDQCHVIHLDHSRDNDVVANLKWVTKAGKLEHRKTNPNVLASPEKVRIAKLKSDGRKLTITRVIHLKKLLNDPERKTRIKMLAKQFGISEMQVFRIKSGENWSHIKV